MGSSGFDPTAYRGVVEDLSASGATFSRSATAQRTGRYDIADHLDPRKLKDGKREACFADGFDDATPIIVSIDGTASMDRVPFDIQRELPKLITLLVEQGISDHPNVLFMCHDDEQAISGDDETPPACFQMSQFESGDKELIAALNELIIPLQGRGNQGESYHLSIYAAAYHTRLESFERFGSVDSDGGKGFFFLIGDEEPAINNGDPTKWGTQKDIALRVFGDKIEQQVTILEALKELAKRYHVFVIRPLATSHGSEKAITKKWQDLLKNAGVSPEHVLEIDQTDAIVSTMALVIGQTLGGSVQELASVLKQKGATGVSTALVATQSLGGSVATAGHKISSSKSPSKISTSDKDTAGRSRR